ncbi:minor tail protein [Microbacterium phage OscarSo]|uniref:Minor tail protein n=1 Tax=Microbacterium phage OscarSo TaxID=2985324 RepID=A0A9X9P5L5_9CAUD|nr:minor tail protein [Microbacterium phage OscarSo]UYL87148.1 minor tail protein [Microbacterium phage OscarSo]
MVTTVEILTPTDTITFYPTPDMGGFVYDNATLTAWYKQAEVDLSANKRPNAHGIYDLGETYLKEHRPILTGQYYGWSREDALAQRDRLAAIYNEGKPVVMRVADERQTTSRIVWLIDRDAPFELDFTHFPFDLVFVAPDPRRYAAGSVVSDGMPTSGTGLVWNLGTAPSGLFFDWGTPGTLGQVAFTNPGQATTYPRIDVGGPGAFDVGFRITEIETGRELRVARATNLGDVVTLDSRTQRATLNGGGDITGAMPSRQWFAVPAGATRRYQINSLGSLSGAPTITLTAAPAYL